MGQYYRPKKQTGNEYVRAVKEFNAYVLHTLGKLPAEWNEFYLKPMASESRAIEAWCIKANSVYMKETDPVLLIRAYETRIGYLTNCLREFDVYSNLFDELMCHIDLMQSERARLKGILCQILKQDGYNYEINNNLPKDPKPDQPTIRIAGHVSDIEYTAENGTERLRLGFTLGNRDHLLQLENKAREMAGKRLSDDRGILKNLKAKHQCILTGHR